MGSGKGLSEKEKITILAHHKTGMSGKKITSEIRSSRVVHKFLKHPKSKKSKGHSKMTPRDKRNLKRIASNSLSAKKIKNTLNLAICERRVQQILASDPNLQYKKMKASLVLTKRHQKNRWKWCNERIYWDDE